MTIKLLSKISNTETNNPEKLMQCAQRLLDDKTITRSTFATLQANINREFRPEQTVARSSRVYYTNEEVLTVLKSHLEVYDGIKNIQAHLSRMTMMFGATSSQVRNGSQYNRGFHNTLNTGNPNIGQSMPSNWADKTLELLQDRKEQFNNTLLACEKIYEATNSGAMLRVIQKWKRHIR